MVNAQNGENVNNKFIELKLGSHTIVHGFDTKNKEIIERIEVTGFSKKPGSSI